MWNVPTRPIYIVSSFDPQMMVPNREVPKAPSDLLAFWHGIRLGLSSPISKKKLCGAPDPAPPCSRQLWPAVRGRGG